jgi:hypothetical protein
MSAICPRCGDDSPDNAFTDRDVSECSCELCELSFNRDGSVVVEQRGKMGRFADDMSPAGWDRE